MIRGGKSYIYLTDNNGSVTGISGSCDCSDATCAYTPYGALASKSAGSGGSLVTQNLIGYTGAPHRHLHRRLHRLRPRRRPLVQPRNRPVRRPGRQQLPRQPRQQHRPHRAVPARRCFRVGSRHSCRSPSLYGRRPSACFRYDRDRRRRDRLSHRLGARLRCFLTGQVRITEMNVGLLIGIVIIVLGLEILGR